MSKQLIEEVSEIITDLKLECIVREFNELPSSTWKLIYKDRTLSDEFIFYYSNNINWTLLADNQMITPLVWEKYFRNLPQCKVRKKIRSL
jgi:hypothetical protein